MILTTTLTKAWTAFTNAKWYLALIVIIDLLFFVAALQLHFAFFIPSAEAAATAGEIMMNEINKLPESEMYQLESILTQNEDFMNAYHTLLGSIALFFVSMLAAFIIFKTPTWYFTHKSIHKKMPTAVSFLKFPLLVLFWFVMLLVILGIYSFFTSAQAFIATGMSGLVALLAIITAFLILYFSQISFALIPSQQTFKKTFIYGIKHAKTIMPAFLVNLLILFVCTSLAYRWAGPYPFFTLAFIILIVLPAIAYTRYTIIVASWR